MKLHAPFLSGGMTMKRILVLVLITLLLLTACVLPGLSPVATPTPQATNTAEPTFTPLPTETSTPEPTATPNVTATAAAHATENAAGVMAELDKHLKNSDVQYKDGHLLWQQTKSFSINLSGPSYEIQKIEEDITAGNFIFKSEITWEASGWLICGTVFRSEPDLQKGRQYQFVYLRLSGLPAWAIEFHEFGFYKNSPSDTRTSAAVDLANGATNTVIVVARDESFEVFINRNREGRYFDYSKQRMEGAFGFLASQDSGKGSCEFENSWVWSLD
jgi:hypothetical protein